MSEEIPNSICFDYSHNDTLVIESPSYADFTHFLFGSSFRLGKIQAGFTNLEKLKNYRMLVIGGPINSTVTSDEIEVIVEYVKQGGSLLVINGEGGDYRAGTNLSELTEHFGFIFNDDIISDSMNYLKLQSRLRINNFEPHILTKNIDTIVLSKPCSLEINSLVDADENIIITPIIKTGLYSYREYYDGEKWIENADAPKSLLCLSVKYYRGKVLALPTLSMFSSLSSAYGYFAFDNQDFISNIFQFLLADDKMSDETLISLKLHYSLFKWAEIMVKEGTWDNINDLINFSMKYFKDNYKEIMQTLDEKRKELLELRKEQLAKIKDMKAREKQKELLESEEAIYEAVERSQESTEDLMSIMAGLSEVTGGEVGADFDLNAIDFDEDEEDEIELKAAAEIKEKLKVDLKEELGSKTESAEDISSELESKAAAENKKEIKDEIKDETKDEITEDIEGNIDSETDSAENISSEIDSVNIISGEKSLEENEIIIPDEKDISILIKDEFNRKLQEKLKEHSEENEQEIVEEIKKSEADEEIEGALKKLGSFDDFKKKLEEFKELSDDDGPISIEPDNKDKDKDLITDDDIFA